MAAKAKKSAKKGKSKKVGKKAGSKGKGGEGRGRKAVLSGELDGEQKKRVRRALRAKKIMLSELPDDAKVVASVKGGFITVKIDGDEVVKITVEARPKEAKKGKGDKNGD